MFEEEMQYEMRGVHTGSPMPAGRGPRRFMKRARTEATEPTPRLKPAAVGEQSPIVVSKFHPVSLPGGLFQQFLQQLSAQDFNAAARILHGLCFDVRCGVDNLETAIPEWYAAWAAESTKASGKHTHALLFKKWVVIGILLSNVNFLERHILETQPVWWKLSLTVACERMNIAMLTLIENTCNIDIDLLPCPVIDILLRRHRTIFERARSVGLTTSDSVLPRCGLSLFRKLAFQKISGNKAYDATAVSLIADLLPTHANIMSPSIWSLIVQFHEAHPSEFAVRTKLYFRSGSYYLERNDFHRAHEQLCAAFDLCPADHPNKIVIFTALVAANLARGMLPSPELASQFAVPQFDDFFVALESGNLMLLDFALRNWAPFFLERQLLGAMHAMRSWVLLNLVVKFYQNHHCKNVLDMNALKEWASPQLDEEADGAEKSETSDLKQAGTSFAITHVLPLLHRGEIRGVIQNQYLIVSKITPFPSFADEIRSLSPPPAARSND